VDGQEIEADRSEGAAPTAVYVYGIVRANTPRDLQVRGIADAPVAEVTHGDLSALVSRVATPVRAKRRELLSHSEVLNAAVAEGTVLPLSFGTVFPDEETLVSDFLEPRAAELRDLLARLAGRVELTLKGYYRQEAVLAAIVRSNPRIARLREATRERPGAGTQGALLELGTAVAAELDARSRTDAAAILDELRPLVADLRVDDRAIEGQVLRASLLVERQHVAAVDAATDAIARRHADRIEFKYVGPLAPHSFVALSPGGGG
jgi:Gas vesicle synthesis protein GvpL/GvpF